MSDTLAGVLAAHEPDCETGLDYDFGSVWLVCSCGWDQNRDRVKNDFVPWSEHVLRAVEGSARDGG